MRGTLSTGVLANMAQWQDRTFEKRCILCSGFLQASHRFCYCRAGKSGSGSRRKQLITNVLCAIFS
jgi:hypothetical protein